MPSYAEGFAISYIEALCCGTPIIGVTENILEHEKILGCRVGIGFNAERENHEDLARKIDELLNSELIENEYRIMLAERAQKYFNEERVLNEYVKLYKSMISK
jgi:glycosyltransferase involved in cell wall biosynthesis